MNILFITYNFPPEGGPAVQRISKFIKYLSQFGANVFVLTAKKSNKIIDNSLLDDIKNCSVYSTYDLGNILSGDFKKILKHFFIPDKSSLWKLTALKKGLQIISEQKIDIIFSTSPPHSTHLIAQAVSKHSGVKWIADFRDEWIDNSLFHRSKMKENEKKLELSVLNDCSHITTITNKAKQNFSQRISNDKISVIRNGYDEDDFTEIKIKEIESKNRKLKFAYAGRLNELHSPKNLFAALSNLFKSQKINPEEISFTFIGGSGNDKWLNEFPELNEIVTFIQYLQHDKMLLKLNEADVMLLLATNMNTTELFPAKMFEYFRLEKYVFAIISSLGELSDTVNEYHNSLIAIESDIEQIQSGILKILSDYKNDKLKVKVDKNFIDSFQRKKQAEQLLKLFQKITAGKNE
ncbi:MAG: glycosyltransferase family 4 protein [Ignavibacteriales bacterium]|nr:glycosyltransferase family 4 protein [Ignavibacteriales bacterium]